MGKLSDLKFIYETYKQDIVNEVNIGITSDAPGLIANANPKPPHITGTKIRTPGQAEEEISHCSSCGHDPCDCSSERQEDGNLEMAKSEVFKILKAANELMNVLQTADKMEPWQLSKLVKASDYLCSVTGSIEYDEFEKCQKDMESGMSDIKNGMVVVSQIKDMLAGEDLSVNEEVLKSVIFNIECLKSR